MGFMLRYITPLSIVPTITLIGLSLFKEATAPAGESWLISGMTIMLVIIFSPVSGEHGIPLSKDQSDRRDKRSDLAQRQSHSHVPGAADDADSVELLWPADGIQCLPRRSSGPHGRHHEETGP